jgi:hypothetical protein
MGKLAEKMYTPGEWKEMTDAMAKVRKPLKSNFARALT